MIQIADIEQMIRGHMEDQPYSCVCAECGAKVDLIIVVDGDMDMRVEVPVCECQKNDG